MEIPSRVAFIHFGKAGGVYTQAALAKTLRPSGYICRNSWADKLGRDWGAGELLGFLNSFAPQLVHNHHINWPEAVVDEYLRNGWFVFTFIRHPAEVIASLYFWGRKLSHQGRNPFAPSGIAPLDFTLDDWFAAALGEPGLRGLWSLPPYLDRLTFVDEFSAMNLAMFLKENFGSTLGKLGLSRRHRNASGSPGFNALVAAGEISQPTIDALYIDANFDEYRKHLDLWQPLSKN